MALSALTAISYGSHSVLEMGAYLRKVDMRTVFFATVAVIVLLVLAYLTNPSETSFRAYLTEQSFRQHLSRLDENALDDQAHDKESGLHFTRTKRSISIVHKSGTDHGTQSPFHFINRASISLRTPRHLVHSFGIFTIAAVLPSGTSQGRGAVPMQMSASTVNDAWFIGAFGKWWRGGRLSSWIYEAIVNFKDAERLTSGILDVKALDHLECPDGLPFATPSTTLHLPSNDLSPKSRDTRRPAQRMLSNSARSSTPPPLPKSASLPLHAPRVPVTPPKTERNFAQRLNQSPVQGQGCNVVEQLRLNTPPTIAYTPSSSTMLFDQSPAIAEILRQISYSKSAVDDLRNQLNDTRTAAAQSHAVIQADLDAQRARKRVDDAARLELKTQTRTLEDAKRAAEGTKRDAEKRLRAAEGARDNASKRMERLDQEIGQLKERIYEDEETVVRVKEEAEGAERAAVEEMEAKKKEIKVAEEVVAALSARAKELEERIVQEEEKLRVAKEQAELKKQDRSFYPLHVVTPVEEDEAIPWSHTTTHSPVHAQDSQSPIHVHVDYTGGVDLLSPTLQVQPSSRGTVPAGPHDTQAFSLSPRPGNLSLGAISNFRDHRHPDSNDNGFLQTHGYSLYEDKGLAVPVSSARSRTSRFSPFGDHDADLSPGGDSISPRSTSLIPSSLISSLEGGHSLDSVSRSFQSEDDDYMAPNWRSLRPPPPPVQLPSPFTTSPTSITNPLFDGVDREDPFEIRPPPPAVRRRLTADPAELPCPFVRASGRTISDPQSVPQLKVRTADVDDANSAAHRRWHSADPKEKKGLNPEAKVFRLTKKSLPTLLPPQAQAQAPAPLDVFAPKPHALPAAFSVPSALPSLAGDSDFLSTLSMRAFAPSREEREALQRALGGTSNASLDRLPTLSEVSLASMPPSPSHVHAIAAQQAPAGREAGSSSTLLPPGLSWLQLPRKGIFSPWEDKVADKNR